MNEINGLNPERLKEIVESLNSVKVATDNAKLSNDSFRNSAERLKVALDKDEASLKKSISNYKVINAAMLMVNGSATELAEALADLSNQEYIEASQLKRNVKESKDAAASYAELTTIKGKHAKSIDDSVKSREKNIKSLIKENKVIKDISKRKKILEVAGRVPGFRGVSGSVSKGFEARDRFKSAGSYLGSTQAKRSLVGNFGNNAATKTAASILGGLGGAISKVAGVAGVATGAVGLLVEGLKAVNKLDKWFKGLNREFVKMAGPTIGGKALKQMKEYNKSLFDIPRNIRLGINSSDIQGMFGQMHSSGMSLQGVKKRAGGYEPVIEEARRLSLQFGVDFATMGGMISDQMLNLKSSLGDVSDTFNKLSYDTQRAGISSEKFYQSVESASSSLGFYGNYMKYASDMIADFTENATLNFKDAGEVTASLLGMYKDIKENRKIASIIGVGTVREMSGDQIREGEKRIQRIDVEIGDIMANPNLTEEKKVIKTDALRKERDALTSIVQTLNQFAKFGGDITAAAEALTYINPNNITSEILKSMDINLLTDEATSIYAKLDKMGMKEKDVAAQRKLGMQIVGDFSNFAKIVANTDFKGVDIGKNVTDDIADKLKMVISDGVAFEDISKDITTIFKGVKGQNNEGLSQKFIDDFMDTAKKSPAVMVEVLKGINEGRFKDIKSEEEANFVLMKLIEENLHILKQGATPNKGTEFAEKDMSSLIAQTEDMDKVLGITAEGIKYALGNDFMKSIAESTYKGAVASARLFDWFSRGKNFWGEHKVSVENRKADEVSKTKEFKKVVSAEVLGSKSSELAGIISEGLGIDYQELEGLKNKKENVSTNDIREAMRLSGSSVELNDDTERLLMDLAKALTAESQAKDYVSESFGKGYFRLDAVQSKVLQEAADILGKQREDSNKAVADRVTSQALSFNNSARELFSSGIVTVSTLSGGLSKALQSISPSETRVPIQNDFAFGSSGLVFGSPGDILIDKDSLAAGIGQGTGGLVGSTLGSMGSSGGINNYWGGITMHISANDAKDLRAAIPDIKRSLETFVDQKIKKSLLNKETKA